MGEVQKMVVLGVVIVAMTMTLRVKWAEAQVHHVVGGDLGWDASHDISSWASGKTFRVGDQILGARIQEKPMSCHSIILEKGSLLTTRTPWYQEL